MSSDYRALWESAGGRVPEHWQFISIEDLLEHPKAIAVGVMYPGENTEDGIPLIKVSDVRSGYISSKPKSSISAEVDEEYKRTRLNGTELLITLVGNPGDCVIATEEMVGWNAARAIAVVRLRDITLRPWIRYILLSSPARHLIQARLNTTVQKTLNLKDIKELALPMPSKQEREWITNVIDSIERKVVINTQTNKTLEQIAQAIFKSWFVDFEPVKAKMAAKQAGATAEQIEQAAICAISGKTPEQLDPQILQQLKTTSALFLGALVDSELGEIPEGWIVKLSGDVIDVRDGTHDSPKQSETGFPLVTSKHITSGVLDINDAYLISEDDYQKINKRSQVNQGDILLTMIGTVGLSYLVMQPTVNFAIKNVGLFRTSDVKELKNYFYLLLKSPVMQGYLEARMVGTTQKYLSLKTLRSIEMITPSIDLLRAFNVQINPIMDKIFELIQENESLSQLKDALLPKLLDGSIASEEFVGS